MVSSVGMGRRVGPLGSTVDIVVGLVIAKVVATGEERGEEIEEEVGALAGACTEIVPETLGGTSHRGRVWQPKRWHMPAVL